MGIAIGRFDFKHAVAQFQNRDIKCSAAQIEYGDLFVLLFIQTVGQRGSGRLIDDTHDIESGNLAGIFGRLTLRIIEVSRNGNDCVLDFFAQIILGGLFHFGQNHRRDFRRGIILAAHGDLCIAVGSFRYFVGNDL